MTRPPLSNALAHHDVITKSAAVAYTSSRAAACSYRHEAIVFLAVAQLHEQDGGVARELPT